jgi:hypothetical protein
MPKDLDPLGTDIPRDMQKQQVLCIMLLLTPTDELMSKRQGKDKERELKTQMDVDMLGGGPFLSQEIFRPLGLFFGTRRISIAKQQGTHLDHT